MNAEGEQTSLARVAFEADQRHLAVVQKKDPADYVDWDYVTGVGAPVVARYVALAAAVEAEVLRRAVAHLERLEEGLYYDPDDVDMTSYRFAIDDLKVYAKQQREGEDDERRW